MRKWIRFQRRQWKLRKIKGYEKSTRKLMSNLGLDYDDVNLRVAVKKAIKESDEWLKNHMIN